MIDDINQLKEDVTNLSNDKVDKINNYSLVENTLINKLQNLANIQTVSDEFNLQENVLSINGIQQDKVVGLPDALLSKVSSIYVGEDKIAINDGVAKIPVASNLNIGVVKGSEKENNIVISENGEMSVYKLNINKLSQDEDDILILDSGIILN